MPPEIDPIDPLEQPESAPGGEPVPSPKDLPLPPIQAGQPVPPVATPASRKVELDARALAATKRSARDEGRKLETERLTKLAQERGYKSLEDMLAAAPSMQSQPDAGATTEEKAHLPAAKRLKLLETENAMLQKKYARQGQALKDLQTEVALRQHAYDSDVKDVDYAVALLRRKVGTMAPAELKTFNPGDYFASLRGQHPYIFRSAPVSEVPTPIAPVAEPIVDKPVSTSPTGRMPQASSPTPPRPADSERAETPVIDTMAMSPEDYRAYLRSKGIRDPRLSV